MTPEDVFAANVMAREDLYFFSRWMFFQRKKYKWLRGPHHKTICDALMRVYRGECKRLIINVAPRYSKTELAVVNFIAWGLGRNPDSEFIHASYSGTLAVNNAAQCRELVRHPAYQAIFPDVVLRDDSQAKHDWRTTKGGVVYATGAGGTITGFGAGKMRPDFGGCILIDDPHKPDEARSDVMRQNVIDWFQNTLESRTNSPDTPIILIMQRLHENDLAGWLLNGGNGEEWEHVCIKTLKDDGTALWPEKHDVERLHQMRMASPYTFAGQYQQSPAPPEGNIFKPDAIEVVGALPSGTRFVRAWDLGATIGGDPTVGGKLGMTPDGRYIIADIVRLDAGPDAVEAAIKNTAARDGEEVEISLPQDPGQAGKVQTLAHARMLAGYKIHTSPESGDKITRAEPLAAQCNVGNVMMLKAPWNDALVAEMRVFPNGTHDDQVDALSRAFGRLIEAKNAPVIAAVAVGKASGWRV